MSDLSGILSLLFIVAAFMTSCSYDPPPGPSKPAIIEYMPEQASGNQPGVPPPTRRAPLQDDYQ